VADAPGAETERLYSLPLDEFTRERDELAKRLRKDGDRDAAGAVKALRKPSVAAWAVNQVRRDRPEDVRRLLEVNEELHRVYAGISSAGARERLEEAASMQRDLIRSLVRCAEQLLDAGGHSTTEATLNKVADTLRAAALDEGLRERIAAGRVVKEERAAGLGPLASMPAARPAKKSAKEKGKQAKAEPVGPDPKEVRRAERAVETARRRVGTARERLEAAEGELAAAERQLRELR
jgi:hypothetical protein